MWEYNFTIIGILIFSTAQFLLVIVACRHIWQQILAMALYISIVLISFPLIAQVIGVPKSVALEFFPDDKRLILSFHLRPEEYIYLWLMDPDDGESGPKSYRYPWSMSMAKALVEASEKSGEGDNGQMLPMEFKNPFDGIETYDQLIHPPSFSDPERKENEGFGNGIILDHGSSDDGRNVSNSRNIPM